MTPLQRFIFYGLFGCFVEICWTACCNLLLSPTKKNKNLWNLTGKTYVWMFPIYSFGLYYIFEALYIFLIEQPFYWRAFIYSSSCLAVEYIAGLILYLTIGSCPWDYSESSYSLHGFIRWDYAPAWAIGGLMLEHVFYFILS